jgi:two-component system sensor histidine kinase PilS (NtrC family)
LAQTFAHIVATALLMYASVGIGSGLDLLMIAAVAAMLMEPGRLALCIAAAGTRALLIAGIYFDISTHATTMSYIQTGLLGASPFLTAWLALTLVHRARQSEPLGSHRGINWPIWPN